MKFRNKKTGKIAEWDCVSINSSKVSAQNRIRLYWTDIKFRGQPEDKEIFLKDIITKHGECINYSSSGRGERGVEKRINIGFKSMTLTKTGFSQRSITGISKEPLKKKLYKMCGNFDVNNMPVIELRGKNKSFKINGQKFRNLNVKEWEKLQTLPENFTKVGNITKAQRKKMIGDGWTIDIIAHILKGMKTKKKKLRKIA